MARFCQVQTSSKKVRDQRSTGKQRTLQILAALRWPQNLDRRGTDGATEAKAIAGKMVYANTLPTGWSENENYHPELRKQMRDLLKHDSCLRRVIT